MNQINTDTLYFLFDLISFTAKIIPIKLHPSDNPINTPLEKSPKLLVSLPPNIIEAKYNIFPTTINHILQLTANSVHP